jgi:hypothetical protein
MAAGGETFAILTFLVGSGVAIAFLDWLLGGVGEAFGLDETPWGDVVCLPEEARVRPTAANSDAGGSGSQERQQASVLDQGKPRNSGSLRGSI